MELLASFFGWRSSSPEVPGEDVHPTTIVLSLDTKSYNVDFKEFEDGFNQATVRDLKKRCKKATGIPGSLMRLMVSGGKCLWEHLEPLNAYLNDDTATLTSVGIQTGSIVYVFRIFVQRPIDETALVYPEEKKCIARIDEVIDPLVTTTQSEIFELDVAIRAPDANEESVARKNMDKIRYFSEILLQAMIKLDAVECPSEFSTAKKRRREGIKIAQQLLDRVDRIKAVVRRNKRR